MKKTKIKFELGDVFAIPLIKIKPYNNKGIKNFYSELKPGDAFSIGQIIALSLGKASPMIIFYSEVFKYGIDNEVDIETSKLTPIFIAEIAVGNGFNDGSFKKITRQPIPQETPYQAYKFLNTEQIALVTFANANGEESASNFPRDRLCPWGQSIMGGVIHAILLETFMGIKSDYVSLNRIIKDISLSEENLLSNFFPEAKNNPEWINNRYLNTCQK